MNIFHIVIINESKKKKKINILRDCIYIYINHICFIEPGQL